MTMNREQIEQWLKLTSLQYCPTAGGGDFIMMTI